MSKPVAATSVKSADNLGLSPDLEVVIAVRRVDGGLLSEEELAAARAALARLAAPQEARPAVRAPDVLAMGKPAAE